MSLPVCLPLAQDLVWGSHDHCLECEIMRDAHPGDDLSAALNKIRDPARKDENAKARRVAKKVISAGHDADAQSLPQGQVVDERLVGFYVQKKWDIFNEKEFLEEYDVDMGDLGMKPNLSLESNENGNPEDRG